MTRNDIARWQRLAMAGDQAAGHHLLNAARRRHDLHLALDAAIALDDVDLLGELASALSSDPSAWERATRALGIVPHANTHPHLTSLLDHALERACQDAPAQRHVRTLSLPQLLTTLARALRAPHGFAWSTAGPVDPARSAHLTTLVLAFLRSDGQLVVGIAPTASSRPDPARCWPELAPWKPRADALKQRLERWAEEAPSASQRVISQAHPVPQPLAPQNERHPLLQLASAPPAERRFQAIIKRLRKMELAHEDTTSLCDALQPLLDASWPHALRVLSANQLDAALLQPNARHLDLYRHFEDTGWLSLELANTVLTTLRLPHIVSASLREMNSHHHAARLLSSPVFPHLRTLNLHKTHWDRQLHQLLLDAPWSPHLEQLHLTPPRQIHESLYTWLRSLQSLQQIQLTRARRPLTTAMRKALTSLPGLSRLGLEHATLSLGNLKSLLRRFGPERLTHLSLVQITTRSAQPIASAIVLNQLQHLVLSGEDIDVRDAEYLAQASHLKKLTHLDLSASAIGDLGVQRIAASSTLRRLTHLTLRDNQLTRRSVQALAASPLAHQLTTLDLADNAITPDAIETLAASPLAHTLRVLNLDGTGLEHDDLEPLLEAPGFCAEIRGYPDLSSHSWITLASRSHAA